MQTTTCFDYIQKMLLTAAMDGFLSSPAGGCVTSAPREITGWLNNTGLSGNKKIKDKIQTVIHNLELSKYPFAKRVVRTSENSGGRVKTLPFVVCQAYQTYVTTIIKINK